MASLQHKISANLSTSGATAATLSTCVFFIAEQKSGKAGLFGRAGVLVVVDLDSRNGNGNQQDQG